MSTLLAIISHPKDNELLVRHWPYFRKLGWPILGCGTVDQKCVWPEPVARLDTGKLGTKATPAGSSIFGLVEQELDIWQWFLSHSTADSVCVVEADNLFVRRPPEHPGHGLYLVTQLPNYNRKGVFKTVVYFSTPRWADRQCAAKLLHYGREMFKAGDHEHWISDRFPAHICHQHHIPWLGQPAWSPSAHVWGGTREEVWRRDARAAVKMGVYCLHAVKEQWQLDAVKDLMTWES